MSAQPTEFEFSHTESELLKQVYSVKSMFGLTEITEETLKGTGVFPNQRERADMLKLLEKEVRVKAHLAMLAKHKAEDEERAKTEAATKLAHSQAMHSRAQQIARAATAGATTALPTAARAPSMPSGLDVKQRSEDSHLAQLSAAQREQPLAAQKQSLALNQPMVAAPSLAHSAPLSGTHAASTVLTTAAATGVAATASTATTRIATGGTIPPLTNAVSLAPTAAPIVASPNPSSMLGGHPSLRTGSPNDNAASSAPSPSMFMSSMSTAVATNRDASLDAAAAHSAEYARRQATEFQRIQNAIQQDAIQKKIEAAVLARMTTQEMHTSGFTPVEASIVSARILRDMEKECDKAIRTLTGFKKYCQAQILELARSIPGNPMLDASPATAAPSIGLPGLALATAETDSPTDSRRPVSKK